MNTNKLILVLSTIVFFTFISCQKDDAQSPTVELQFETVTSSFTVKSTMSNHLQFTSGHIILESASIETNSEIESYITIDFATGETTPDIWAIEIIPGNYTEVEIEMELWDQTDIPSIALDGTWTDTYGTDHPVQLALYLGQ